MNQPNSGPACDSKKLFIEVSGKREQDELGFRFFKQNTQDIIPPLAPKETYEQQDQPAVIQGQKVNPRGIYSWDWSKQQSCDVYMVMPCNQGEICIPLFNNITASPRRFQEQDHKVTAIIPLVELPTNSQKIQKKEYESSRLAPIRQGFLYFFYQGKVWREIAAIQDENQMTFQEADLSQYRDTSSKVMRTTPHVCTHDEREITGKAMPCIWLPEKQAGKKVDLSVAFSEVQWSPEYINYIEANPDYQSERFRPVYSSLVESTELSDMRLREEDIEMWLDEPQKFNQDLSGQYVTSLHKQLVDFESELHQNHDVVLNLSPKSKSRLQQYSIRSEVLQKIVDKQEQDISQFEVKVSANYLGKAKEYNWSALVVSDPLFELRHTIHKINFSNEYLTQIIRDTKTKKYIKAAEAVNSIIMPRKYGAEENSNHKYKKSMDNGASGVFHRTLRSLERELVKRDIQHYQQQLIKKIEDKQLLSALRDITSLNNANAASGIKLGGLTFSALCINTNQLDPYEVNPSDKSDDGQEATLFAMDEENQHPLYPILFLPENSMDITKPYNEPKPFNDGSGLATPEKFAQCSGSKLELSLDQVKTPEMASTILQFHTQLEKDNPLYNFTNGRHGTTLAGNILESYYAALSSIDKFNNEAILVKFKKAYRGVVYNFKAFDPKLMSELTFTSVDKATNTSGYILGFEYAGKTEGLPIVGKKIWRFGDIHDDNGELVSTNKARAAKQVEKENVIKLKESPGYSMLPKESELVDELHKPEYKKAFQNMNKTKFNISNAYTQSNWSCREAASL